VINPQEKERLLAVYEKNKPAIASFLKKANRKDDEHILSELMFCLQTAQSSAKSARKTIEKLKEKNILFAATESEILELMEGVRFADKKAGYLYRARAKLPEIKSRLGSDPKELRAWLIDNIDGMGPKLASHFLRNIGVFGLAILDVHVQNFLKRNNLLVGEVGKLNLHQYGENEEVFLKLAEELGILPQELDIAIWMLGNGSGEFYG
jgi:N-glycosylase/DNA lyase